MDDHLAHLVDGDPRGERGAQVRLELRRRRSRRGQHAHRDELALAQRQARAGVDVAVGERGDLASELPQPTDRVDPSVAVDLVQADRLPRRFASELARIFERVDVLLVPSLRDESLVVSNYTGHPSLTLRAGFVEVKEARSDWAPDPANPLPTFSTPRRVPHGVTLIGRLFDEGTIVRVGRALEQAAAVASERPQGF